jgi:hypothetical protein
MQIEKEKQNFVDLTKMPQNIPIKGHTSHEALCLITEGIKDVIPQIDPDESMTLLVNLDNLPKSAIAFATRLQPNTVAVFDKEGTLYLEINLNILRDITCFQMFLSFYHSLLSEFPDLKPYVALCEGTEHHRVHPPKGVQVPENYPKEIWLTKHFYVTLNVSDLLIAKLHSHFAPDEYPAPASFSYLLSHGFDKEALSTTFKVSRATLFNYQAKTKKFNESPDLRQPEATE